MGVVVEVGVGEGDELGVAVGVVVEVGVGDVLGVTVSVLLEVGVGATQACPPPVQKPP